MDVSTVVIVVLVIAIIGWMGYRQTTWTAISPTRSWRTPAIVAAVGAVLLVNSGALADPDAGDIAVLVLELSLGAGIGAAIGVLAHLRPVTAETLTTHGSSRRSSDPAPAIEARNGAIGLGLWIGMIALRIVLGVWATSWGAHLAESTGVILIVLGLNRLVRTSVILARASHPVASRV